MLEMEALGPFKRGVRACICHSKLSHDYLVPLGCRELPSLTSTPDLNLDCVTVSSFALHVCLFISDILPDIMQTSGEVYNLRSGAEVIQKASRLT